LFTVWLTVPAQLTAWKDNSEMILLAIHYYTVYNKLLESLDAFISAGMNTGTHTHTNGYLLFSNQIAI